MSTVIEELSEELAASLQQLDTSDRSEARGVALLEAMGVPLDKKQRTWLMDFLKRRSLPVDWFAKLVKVAKQKLEMDEWRATEGSPETMAALDQRRTEVIKQRRELLEQARKLEIEEHAISARQRSAGAMDGDIRTFQLLNPIMFSDDVVKPREFELVPLSFDEARQTKHTPPAGFWGTVRR